MRARIAQAGAIGSARVRVDGEPKLKGTAIYAYEHPVRDPLYAHIVPATIASGHVSRLDTASAEALDGVIVVVTHENATRLADGADQELQALQSDEVAYRGQAVALVVAESLETAREAAALVTVSYDERAHDAQLRSDRNDLYAPDEVNPGFPTDTEDGDLDAALESASVTVDETYSTAWQNNNPMEPHTTIAVWGEASDGDATVLTLYDSTQGVHQVRTTVAPLMGLADGQVRVVAPYVGGGFGSKGTAHPHVVLAALAARATPGRPVKLALTRQQMFSLVGYRTPTIQRVRLAADAEGRLGGLGMDVVEQTARIKEFAEQTAVPARVMYAAGSRRTSHRLAALDVPVPSWMRAPGECPGMFGPEVAMDELAYACGVDPIELRRRNEPDVEPDSGKPFSSRNLMACFDEGAERFGWGRRDPEPGVRLEGDWLTGTGVASSTYPVNRMDESSAAVRFEGDGRYVVSIGFVDIGTGAWTALGQIAADALGVAPETVDLRIGDSALPVASVAGGSSGTNTWGSAIVAAARAFHERHGDDPSPGDEARADLPANEATERYAMHAYGAQFAAVRVHVHTGELRMARLLGVFAAGRIVNPLTARSQFLGGMTMGLSMALHEDSVLDPRFGHIVNHDLAEYHVAANADVVGMEAHWIDEHDPHVNPMGVKGIGEIGIVGTAAAISNAAFHATGIRVRDLPITPDKLLVSPARAPV